MHRREFIATGLAVLGAPMMPAALSAQEKKPITWWYETAAQENQENLQNLLVKVFNEGPSRPELSIDFRGQELDKELRVAMLSGSGPTSSTLPARATSPRWRRLGKLLALDDYAQKLGWNNRVLPLFVELGKYNGKLYALPKPMRRSAVLQQDALRQRRLDAAHDHRRVGEARRHHARQGASCRSRRGMPTGVRPTSTTCRSCSIRSAVPAMSTRR